jgi:signal transduction histidine kinase/DNA-binding response OmpR family regulator
MPPRPDRILDYREYPILCVDDEPENLRLFELAFKREFSIVTAKSGEEGLERLNSEPVALVLSDHRMPGMSGVEFLTRACELVPKTIRILVTAYGDAQTLGSAINSGAIYKYIPKPWMAEEMRLMLRRGIETYALDRERERLLRDLTLLSRVSRSIAQELTLEPLLNLLLETMTKELGYDGASILFFDAAENRLSEGRFAPADSAVSESLRDLEISQQAAPSFIDGLRQGEAQRLSIEHAIGSSAPLSRWVTEVAAEEILVIPLVGKQRTIGILAVDNRCGGHRFTGDDQTLLEGLAQQAVIAIENARLVEELRRSREQVRRADRLGTLGALATRLAHEIDNPLVSIHTFLSMAPTKRDEADEEFWGDYHALASRDVDRIRRLVETMRLLGRDTDSSTAREAFDPGELAEEVIALVACEAAQTNVEITLERDPDTPKLVAVRDHMHQVFLNLLLNALHASPPGASVQLRILPDSGGEGLCVEVSDSGGGVPEEHLSRIFDPFFAAEDPDQGTGLELMICHRLVTAHGGEIEVRSREGEGSTYCVRLPAGQEMGAPARAGSA